jgi:tetratricopeptide (TPR) repeat protein
MKLNFLALLFTQIVISQTNDFNQLLADGEKAFLDNNFILAKEIYTKATSINSKNKDSWYNLAASELNLGEKENACEHFYQAYLLDDGEALKNIKEYCPNFRNGTILSIDEVEEKPKFIYDDKEYSFLEKNNLNSVYLKILVRKFKNSKILNEKVKGKVYIQFKINKYNAFEGKVIRVGAEEKDVEIVKAEIISILKNMVTYISAKNKGINVDLWDKWVLPLTF